MATCGKCKMTNVPVAHVRDCYAGVPTLTERLMDIASPAVGTRLIDRASTVYDDKVEDPEAQIFADEKIVDWQKLEAEMDAMVQEGERAEDVRAYTAKMERDDALAAEHAQVENDAQADFEAQLPRGTVTDAQLSYLEGLVEKRDMTGVVVPVLRGLSKAAASDLITEYKLLPWKPREDRPEVPAVTEPGVYRQGEQVFLVQFTKDTQRLYAKRLVNFDGTRLAQDGEHVKFEWEFAPGAVHRLTPSDKMSVEEAKAFMLVYKSCLRCNRKLKAAKSVEQGIGPVCITYFA
jgi:hypothetical protein